MLPRQYQKNQEEMCDVCGETVMESCMLWHPRQNWSGVWLTLCEPCLDDMEN